jgi:lysophospholipase L1-like esterase
VFTFVIAEIALRAADYPRREAKLLCLDPIVHNVFCPSTAGIAGDTKTPVAINKDGMADREYGYVKPSGTLRVALLGDSVTASIYTAEGRKFEQLWETMLAERLRRPVEILNFGIDGTGTWEQVQLFHLRARKFSPDYVVLAFYWGNDVWNNAASLSRKRPNPLKDEYDSTGWITSIKVAHRNTIRWLWNHSAAFQFLDRLKTTVETQFDYRRALRAKPEVGAATATVAEESDPAMLWNSDAWELTRQLIVKLNSEALSANAKLVVFGIPMLDQITRPRPLPYRQFRAFLATHEIAAIDLFDELATLTADQKKALYIGDNVHLSEEGHRFFAATASPHMATALSSGVSSALAGGTR